jgi:hypothetical protein
MTSVRQIEANRRNALLSTGQKTDNGKRWTRHNAVRHGLTAETVVVALEGIRDYQAFEAAIIADYDARTAIERELVLRLASLLWRIRRATAIETDLLQIQAEILHDRRNAFETTNEAEQKLYDIVYRALRTTMRPDGCNPAEQARHHRDDPRGQERASVYFRIRRPQAPDSTCQLILSTRFLRRKTAATASRNLLTDYCLLL